MQVTKKWKRRVCDGIPWPYFPEVDEKAIYIKLPKRNFEIAIATHHGLTVRDARMRMFGVIEEHAHLVDEAYPNTRVHKGMV